MNQTYISNVNKLDALTCLKEIFSRNVDFHNLELDIKAKQQRKVSIT